MGSTREERLRSAFDPERFRHHGEALVDKLRTYLADSFAAKGRALPWEPPRELAAEAERLLAQDNSFSGLVDFGTAHMHRLHSPRYMGHQTPPSLPTAALFESLALVGNQSGAIYEMSPFCSVVEQVVIAKLGERIGWKRGEFAGIGTHGGSLANLTAILAARNIRYRDSWEKGFPAGAPQPAVLVSEGAHYSVARAAGIVGIGTANVLRVIGDAKHRMRAEAVDRAIVAARDRGQDPFCLVASSCSTSVGAFDPLPELAMLARERGLWLHVDGAHGASTLFSPRYRHLVDGIAEADSVAWDAHKMLYMPLLSTYLFYRREADSWAAFQQDAPYLFDRKTPGLGAFDGALRTFECTKRSLSTGLWGAWAIHGEGLFTDLVEASFDLAREFHALLSATDDFVPLHEPEANILCFRYVPAALRDDPAAVDALQPKIRRALVEEGPQYITGTRLAGRAALRVTLINPFTTAETLRELLTRIRELAREL